MGFWDFFLGKNREKEEIKVERIFIEELNSWLPNKKRQIEKQEESYLKLIHERISQLIQELEQEKYILKKINIEERRAEDKIKLIVKENLSNYADYVENLINKLGEISKEKVIIEKINSIFSDFKKKSAISFEKATFLIGKELASVKESIKNFFRDLEKILEENKELIDSSKIISSVEKKIEKHEEIKKIKFNIQGSIDKYGERINNLGENIKIREDEIKNIKESGKFIRENKKKEELVCKQEELEKEIYRLREMIDFKSLANFFHIFEKEMSIIKDYRENFRQAFSRTNGEELLALLKEAKMQDAFILNKIQNIAEKKKEIESIAISKTGIEDIEAEIREVREEIGFLNSQKIIEEKKFEKLDKNLKEIISLLREDLIKMNVQVLSSQ